jgi:hypothetical protein
LVLYALTLFVSAFLLFLVQPMVAKMMLPLLGGTPGVWTTCMLFFQAALLGGYAYAHWAPGRLGIRRHALLHVGVLALPLLILPINLTGLFPPGNANPASWLLQVLLLRVGLPFFTLATSAPLLQIWFSSSRHSAARDPYFLYAASNAGSLLALLSYPLFFEPAFRLSQQTQLWTAGYAFFLLLVIACVSCLCRSFLSMPLSPAPEVIGNRSQLAARARLRWLVLAFVPSSLMLGVTTYLTTDVAPVPLLWVIPLALYLFSFIATFSAGYRWHPLFVVLLPGAIFGLLAVFWFELDLGITNTMALHLAAFFIACMVCHGELAAARPPASRLTEYYLWISLGGVLGGIGNAIVAPIVLDRVIEYPLVIAIACLLLPCTRLQNLARARDRLDANSGLGDSQSVGMSMTFGLRSIVIQLCWIIFGLTAAGLFYWQSAERPNLQNRSVLLRERNFFGVLRVTQIGPFHYLGHGTTLHGQQCLGLGRQGEPLGYYYPTGPIGEVFSMLNRFKPPKHVAVVGLGAGTLACYAQSGQDWTFYEINPAVEAIAYDDDYFTYLKDCEARGVRVRVILGDARLRLEDSRQPYDLLVIDAFSSDSIPLHLLTREAFQLYKSRLAEGGILAIHITNRYLELAPVLGDLCKDANLYCLCCQERLIDMEAAERQRATNEVRMGKILSDWVVCSQTPQDLRDLSADRRWREPAPRPGSRVWTDDYSNPASVLQWRGK